MLYRPESAIFAHLFSAGTLNHGPNRQLPALVMGCQLDDDVADDKAMASKHQQNNRLSVIAGVLSTSSRSPWQMMAAP